MACWWSKLRSTYHYCKNSPPILRFSTIMNVMPTILLVHVWNLSLHQQQQQVVIIDIASTIIVVVVIFFRSSFPLLFSRHLCFLRLLYIILRCSQITIFLHSFSAPCAADISISFPCRMCKFSCTHTKQGIDIWLFQLAIVARTSAGIVMYHRGDYGIPYNKL